MPSNHVIRTRRIEQVNQTYEELLASILEWAQGEDAIRAVIQVGSRVRQDHPADEWADLDLMFYATTPEIYIESAGWIEMIAPVWIAIQSRTAGGDPEQLVIFEGGYSVDFVFCPWNGCLKSLRMTHCSSEALVCYWIATASPPAFSQKHPLRQPPTPADFDRWCNMFWYVSIYIARQIRRGDLWLAKIRDAQQKECVLRMLEWHTGVMSQGDTWHNGRFIDERADARALPEIYHIFGGYSAHDASKALHATVTLFSRVAQETAAGLGYISLIGLKSARWC